MDENGLNEEMVKVVGGLGLLNQKYVLIVNSNATVREEINSHGIKALRSRSDLHTACSPECSTYRSLDGRKKDAKIRMPKM